MGEKIYYSIDRIEENIAVCESDDGSHINLDAANLYSGAKEGDVFFLENEEYFFDEAETNKRREENVSLLKDILSK